VRWLLLGILAYIVLVMQTTLFVPGALAVRVHGHWARPDLMLVVGMFVALYFEPKHALAAGCLMGLGCDLAAVGGRLGLMALLFAAALTALASVRSVLNRGWVLTQSACALGLVLAVHGAWYMAVRHLGGADPAPLRSLEEALLDGVYTGILAPYLVWALLRLRGPLEVTLEPGEIQM